MSDPIPIDPALTANEEAYRSTLSGIFPSSNLAPKQEQRGSLGGESIVADAIDYDNGVEPDGSGATPDGVKKRKKSVNEADDDKPKRLRQSRECQQSFTGITNFGTPLIGAC